LFTCSLVHLFTRSLVHSFTCSLVHLFTCSLVHLSLSGLCISPLTQYAHCGPDIPPLSPPFTCSIPLELAPAQSRPPRATLHRIESLTQPSRQAHPHLLPSRNDPLPFPPLLRPHRLRPPPGTTPVRRPGQRRAEIVHPSSPRTGRV
jgi:hypothetical protein